MDSTRLTSKRPGKAALALPTVVSFFELFESAALKKIIANVVLLVALLQIAFYAFASWMQEEYGRAILGGAVCLSVVVIVIVSGISRIRRGSGNE